MQNHYSEYLVAIALKNIYSFTMKLDYYSHFAVEILKCRQPVMLFPGCGVTINTTEKYFLTVINFAMSFKTLQNLSLKLCDIIAVTHDG